MKILLCQIKPKTGAIEHNGQIIAKHYKEAEKKQADICVFPELALTGYLAEDLFLNPGFIADVHSQINSLINITNDCCLLIPAPIIKNGLLYNAVIVAQNRKIIGTTYKQELPNYGIFDEHRYFTPGNPQIILVNNTKIGIPICEDIWFDAVCRKLKNLGAEILISVNASPFEMNKFQTRVKKVSNLFQRIKIPIIYCNQVGAQDGIIFDGKSFCYDGNLKITNKAFEEDVQFIQYINKKFHTNIVYNLLIDYHKEIYQAIILGVKSYVQENGFKKVVLGLSGGIDSAMVAQIAVDAIGKSNVSTFMLSSKFTSEKSIEDAKEVAKILDISLKTINIDNAVKSLSNIILDNKNNTGFNKSSDSFESSIVYQNLQSRIRGVILMAEANRNNALLLTTGNKSELATGYATIYGDMNGGFNPIKDLYKTKLYELAKYTNIIPRRIIEKEPSAELALNQKDSDFLPEYDILDQILQDHIEHNKNLEELSKKFEPFIVDKVLKLVKNSEFKRRQSAPGIKISTKNFEKDRRFPITNHYGKLS